MTSEQPSRTAWNAACHRAAHQALEQGRIFSDPLALPILGAGAEAVVADAEKDPSKRMMRIFIAVRTRFAEDALASAVERGARQLVVLGAGLDTLAYRSPYQDRLQIFEVDHPATQEWKRGLIREAGIPEPAWLTYAPVDFERDTLSHGLSSAGFDPALPTFFMWLGVVLYLSTEAVWSTLRYIGGLSGCAQVVFDYGDPPDTLSPEERAFHDRNAARVEALGETWVTYFEPAMLHSKLRALGFSELEDLGPRQIVERYLGNRAAPPSDRGIHILKAGTLKCAGSAIAD